MDYSLLLGIHDLDLGAEEVLEMVEEDEEDDEYDSGGSGGWGPYFLLRVIFENGLMHFAICILGSQGLTLPAIFPSLSNKCFCRLTTIIFYRWHGEKGF